MLPGQKLVNGHISVEPLPPPLAIVLRERGTRSPARFAPPRGRGGDRSVPRGCPEPAAPLGPAGGAGSAHPLRTRRLGRGARRGAGPPTCLPSGTPDWCRASASSLIRCCRCSLVSITPIHSDGGRLLSTEGAIVPKKFPECSREYRRSWRLSRLELVKSALGGVSLPSLLGGKHWGRGCGVGLRS